MTELKNFIVSILIVDPMSPNLSTNKENYILSILNEKYVGKCYNGAFIVKIDNIINISACSIITTNLDCSGNINVQFIARVRIFYPGEFISGVHIKKTQLSILGDYTEDTDDGIIKTYIMIPMGVKFEPSPLKHSILSIKENQRIPMRIIDVYHKCANSNPAIGATLLVCDQKYYKYIITAPLSNNISTLLLPLMEKIETEMQLRNSISDPDIQQNILFFESLLYSYQIDAKSAKKVNILSEKFPQWRGLEQISSGSSSSSASGSSSASVSTLQLNILDFAYSIIEGRVDNVVGTWSRPLFIAKSSPMAIYEASVVDINDEITLEEGNPDTVFIRYLKDILDYLTIIRKMSEYYTDKAMIMAHKNIWDAMREVQKIGI
jgi:DNA-directed RNA polymerase subunit E'/Rpb7